MAPSKKANPPPPPQSAASTSPVTRRSAATNRVSERLLVSRRTTRSSATANPVPSIAGVGKASSSKPIRRTADSANRATLRDAPDETPVSTRVTRRSTAAGLAPPPVVPKEPPAKKPKPDAEKRKARAPADKSKATAPAHAAEEAPPPASKNIVVNVCKHCNALNSKALELKQTLEAAFPDTTVEINPEKQQQGCFEIQCSSGQISLSYRDIKLSQATENLDLDAVVQDTLKKFASSEDAS